MKLIYHFYWLFLGFCMTSSLWAQNNDASRWTPEDIIHTEYMRSVSISPNNDKVLWTKRKGLKKEDKFVSDIYLTLFTKDGDATTKTIALTNGKENDYSPLFSKDGEDVYFLSSRDKGKHLWRMSLYGGEPASVHTFENGISNISWLNDSTLLFVSSDGKTLYDLEAAEKKDNVVVVEDEDHWRIDRVFAFDVKGKAIKRLTDNDFPVSSYVVSKDGQWLIYRLTMSRHFSADGRPAPTYYLKNLNTGQTQQILEGLQTPGSFKFTADHQGFYFVAIQSSDPQWGGAGVGKLYYYDLTTKDYQPIDLQWENDMHGRYEVIGNDILVTLPNGAVDGLAFYEKSKNWQKTTVELGDRQDHVTVLAISDDGEKVVFEHSTASQLPKYFFANWSFNSNSATFGEVQELNKMNAKLAKKSITKSEVFTWKGWNDEEVNGVLYYPEDYEPGKRYPLMLSIHGGPTGVDRDRWSERWSTYPQILAQRGAFVLKPNYHGSSNHGLAFIESIKNGMYYTPELVDITKGIDALVDNGMVDRQQLGVMGWSNGAILATKLTLEYPDMFKVACPGAGDINWTSDYGTCRFGVKFDQSYFGGAPWDDVDGKSYNEKYILLSPLFEIEKIITPTIIFHGSADRAVPRDQGWEYYRGLQQNKKAPVKFLWFPDQPHGLQKITHQLRKMNEELAWIDQYLFEKEIQNNEAFKKESPLAYLLERESAAKSGRQYGHLKNGVLIPEMMDSQEDSISIGRFEVTNAQFSAFKSDHDYPKGWENYPAMVSFIDAQAYISWLNQKTGDTYRLPNQKEAKTWHKIAIKQAGKENTFNYWAGYQVQKSDAEKLKAKLADLKEGLIKTVGSHPPVKVAGAMVFDIGGNVSEYSQDGKTYGYSAYDFVDTFDTDAKVNSQYTGFRVVSDL